jgi:hypothetical protein
MKGDTCSGLSISKSISIADFEFLNPTINRNCTDLLLGIAYCVQPVGDISTYPNYTSSGGGLKIHVPTASFPPFHPTATPTTPPSEPFIYTPSYLPHAPGTRLNCGLYANYDDGGRKNARVVNKCEDVASLYGMTLAELQSRNPSLASNESDCVLQKGYSYCVDIQDSWGEQTLGESLPTVVFTATVSSLLSTKVSGSVSAAATTSCATSSVDLVKTMGYGTTTRPAHMSKSASEVAHPKRYQAVHLAQRAADVGKRVHIAGAVDVLSI